MTVTSPLGTVVFTLGQKHVPKLMKWLADNCQSFYFEPMPHDVRALTVNSEFGVHVKRRLEDLKIPFRFTHYGATR
jgi:hypothetical protein